MAFTFSFFVSSFFFVFFTEQAHMCAETRSGNDVVILSYSCQRQKKRDAEEADKVEVAPGVTVASLRRFRTALIGPTQGLPERRRLCH